MFGLTQEEEQVILFLASLALMGMGVNCFVKKNPTLKSWVSVSENLTKLDLNKADKEALINLPGIGEKLAQRILDYRRQNGDFTSLGELKKIKGITECRYQKLKELLFLP